MAQIICTMALTSCTGKKNDDTGTVKESSKKSSSSSKANPESDFRVELTDDGTGVRILEYIESSPNVIIPETIQGMTVTEINPGFCVNEEWIDELGTHKSNKFIKKLIFPDTVREFSGEYTEHIGALIALEYVKLPKYLKNKTYNKVSMIGPNELVSTAPISFGGCTSLKSIKIPASVKRFTNSFWGCTSLKEIIFPETATNYEFEGSYVFAETNLPVTTQAKIKQLGYTEGF